MMERNQKRITNNETEHLLWVMKFAKWKRIKQLHTTNNFRKELLEITT